MQHPLNIITHLQKHKIKTFILMIIQHAHNSFKSDQHEHEISQLTDSSWRKEMLNSKSHTNLSEDRENSFSVETISQNETNC